MTRHEKAKVLKLETILKELEQSDSLRQVEELTKKASKIVEFLLKNE